MSRRSIYRTSRTNNTAYGPKTDNHVQHWQYDFIDLATTREEESETPQKGNAFRVKTWIKIEDSQYKPLDIGAENDGLELVNRIQAAADEIAHKEGELGASETPEVATSTSVLPGPEEPKPMPPRNEDVKPEASVSESAGPLLSQPDASQPDVSQPESNGSDASRITDITDAKMEDADAEEVAQNADVHPITRPIDEHAMAVDSESISEPSQPNQQELSSQLSQPQPSE